MQDFRTYIRVQHNKTLKDLAKASNISYHTLKAYSQNKMKPSPDKITQIAKALDVTETDIINLFYKEG